MSGFPDPYAPEAVRDSAARRLLDCGAEAVYVRAGSNRENTCAVVS